LSKETVRAEATLAGSEARLTFAWLVVVPGRTWWGHLPPCSGLLWPGHPVAGLVVAHWVSMVREA